MLLLVQTPRAGVMQKFSIISITLSVLAAVTFTSRAYADIEWSGVFRFEGNHIKNSDLNDRGRELGYGVSHLVLRPKIVAGDGLTIWGQFNIFNEDTIYKNSQHGQIWGNGVGDGTPSSTEDSNAISDNTEAESIKVSQLYMTLNHEYGQLIVGRAPIQFGLGMTHSAGRGLFDHWYDTRDLVGYKFIVGNMYFLPMYGKVNEGAINANDDMNDYMIHAQYENPESEIEMGVFYQMRKGSESSSDVPVGAGLLGTTAGAEVDSKLVNIYAQRSAATWRVGLEAAFQSGEVGAFNAGGEKVTWGGFGLALETELRPEGSRWNWGLNAGTASGDDPATDTKFEGFIFDRNYDVAMLMFNRPLGQDDFLRTNISTGSVRTGGVIDKVDVESVSNVMYIAPRARYIFNDRWSLDNTLITGWIGTNPITGQDTSKDLGYEWDISLNFSPRKGVMWVNQAGFLFPGAAWEGGTLYESEFAFGLSTKAAISF
jgi:hypothetical protein